MTFFSVIIPTYNRIDFLTEAVDTVLLQTYPDFEVIIVDDGSTDNTKSTIEEKYKNDTRVRYFYKQNEERGAARNFGLKQAFGNYAVFLDSDDWMKPHYLESLKSIIDKQPDIFLLAAKYDYKKGNKNENNPELSKLAEGWYSRDFFLKGNILACNFCIKIKNCSYAFFPEEKELASMEDWLFLLRNLNSGKIFIKDEICLTMQQHEGRSMMNNQKVIEARKKATSWVLENILLNKDEQKKLKAWSHYFCGVHQYLDYKRSAAVKETMYAIGKGGINRSFIILLSKSVIGKKMVVRLK